MLGIFGYKKSVLYKFMFEKHKFMFIKSSHNYSLWKIFIVFIYKLYIYLEDLKA